MPTPTNDFLFLGAPDTLPWDARNAWYIMRHHMRLYRRKFAHRTDEETWDRTDSIIVMAIVRQYGFSGSIAFQ